MGMRAVSAPSESRQIEAAETSLKERVSHVLDELRVVLPGTQALLGFQFIAVLSNGFESLPDWVRYIHFASLTLIAMSAVCLMTPASFHRIVEHGRDTEPVHDFASLALIAAMALLGAGMSLDFVTVAWIIFGSAAVTAVAGVAGIFVSLAAWFAYPALVRAADRR